MCRGVVTCRVNANAADAARIMLDNDVSALVVVDERLRRLLSIDPDDETGN